MCTQKISTIHFTLQLIRGYHYYHLTFRDRDSSMILSDWFKGFFLQENPIFNGKIYGFL